MIESYWIESQLISNILPADFFDGENSFMGFQVDKYSSVALASAAFIADQFSEAASSLELEVNTIYI